MSLRVGAYDEKTVVVVDGCVRRLEVVDPGGVVAVVVCVFTLKSLNQLVYQNRGMPKGK